MWRCKVLIYLTFAFAFGIISGIQSLFAATAVELSSTHIYFTQNVGQFGEKTLFRGESGNTIFYFCRDEVAYLFVRDTGEMIDEGLIVAHDDMAERSEHPRYKKEGMLIRTQFIGANPGAEIIGENRLSHSNNYFLGSDPSGWRTNVPNYSTVLYKGIYPGIDLRYYGNNAALKYDFIVHPGADLSQIQIRYNGVADLAISGYGDLQLHTEFGTIAEKAPYAYQDVNGITQNISAEYEIIEPGVFGFRVDGNYDLSEPLVIDPQLIYSTFLGGSGGDYANGIEFDPDGNMVITGWTSSGDFPMSSPYQGNIIGSADIFVTKLSSSGDSLLFSTFIGGSDEEGGMAVDTDHLGNICIMGISGSDDFPLSNAFDSTAASGVFEPSSVVFKLSPNGDSLIFSTYYSGSELTQCFDLTVDDDDNILVAGETTSHDLPVYNAYCDSNSSTIGYDAILLKLPPEGGIPIFSTYLGGSMSEYGLAVCAENNGNIVLTGMTQSDDFPYVDPYKVGVEGDFDIFISKFSPLGDQLLYSTTFGGNDIDGSTDIEIDESGNVFIAGYTESTDFPLINAFDQDVSGREGVLFKLAIPSNILLFSTYLGGLDREYVNNVELLENRAIVGGNTRSADFPIMNPYQSYLRGIRDAFVSVFNIAGDELLYSTYFGGSDYDDMTGMDIDEFGNIAITGEAVSADFPLVNPYDSTLNGGVDIFISKFSSILPELDLGGISGIVTDTGSTPLENVFVTIMEAPIGDITNAGGVYSIENLDPSTYDVYVSHPDYVNRMISDIEVFANLTTTLDIVLYNVWEYDAGDSNGDENVNGLDVIYSVNYLKGGPAPPFYIDCPGHGYIYAAADANGSCEFNGLDITYSVAYFKGMGPAPSGCPDCPPRH